MRHFQFLIFFMMFIASFATHFARAAEPMISGGYTHNLAVRADGTVWGWGMNDIGQLGFQPQQKDFSPLQIQGMSDVVRVAAAGFFSLFLKADGTVWSCGQNIFGELGTGKDEYYIIQPELVSSLSDVIDIKTGYKHALALKTDGTVWAWGLNNFGQLGNGTTEDQRSPVQVLNLTDVIAIAAGENHSFAVKSDGTLWAWGNGNRGELGHGTDTSEDTPVQVTGVSGITAVAAGRWHSIALRADGTVWSWGSATFGQLGGGDIGTREWPEMIASLTDVRTISSGLQHCIAIKYDGSVWAWGMNDNGRLGVGITEQQDLPVRITALPQGTAISAGNDHSLVMTPDGAVWNFGDNSQGQLADLTTTEQTTPVIIPDLNLISPDNGSDTDQDGIVDAQDNCPATVNSGQGDANHNQIGDACDMDSDSDNDGLTDAQEIIFNSSPGLSDTDFDGLTDFEEYTAGTHPRHSDSDGDGIKDGTDSHPLTPIAVPMVSGTPYGHILALKSDGTIWAWEDNDKPVQVKGITNAVSVYAGSNHSLCILEDGTVWAWGENDRGQLGNGTSDNSAVPVQVSGISNVVSVLADSFDSSYAVLADGTVWAWGYIVGSDSNSYVPVKLTEFSNVRHLANGGTQSYLLKKDGTVWTVPRNQTSISEQVQGISDISELSCGSLHTLALKNDGTVWAWNRNDSGQLGNGTTEDSTTPVQVSGLTDVVKIAGGGYHSLAIKSDGTLWAWGYGFQGRLGIGSDLESKTTPVQTHLSVKVFDVMGTGSGSLALSNTGAVWLWGDNILSPIQKLGLYVYHQQPAKFMAAGNPDTDSDGDGVPDHKDFCPETPSETPVDAFGCAIAKGDINRDGRIDLKDVMTGLKVITAQPDESFGEDADIDEDGTVDIKDIVYIIQHARK